MDIAIISFWLFVTICSAWSGKYSYLPVQNIQDYRLTENPKSWVWAPLISFPAWTTNSQLKALASKFDTTTPSSCEFKDYKPVCFLFDPRQAKRRGNVRIFEPTSLINEIDFASNNGGGRDSAFCNLHENWDRISPHRKDKYYMNWIYAADTISDIHEDSPPLNNLYFWRYYFFADELREWLVYKIKLHGLIVITTENHYEHWFRTVLSLQIRSNIVIPIATALEQKNLLQYLHDLSFELYPMAMQSSYIVSTKSFVLSARLANKNIQNPERYLKKTDIDKFLFYFDKEANDNYADELEKWARRYWSTYMEAYYSNLTGHVPKHPVKVNLEYMGRKLQLSETFNLIRNFKIEKKRDTLLDDRIYQESMYNISTSMADINYHIFITNTPSHIQFLEGEVRQQLVPWYQKILETGACVAVMFRGAVEIKTSASSKRLAFVDSSAVVQYPISFLEPYYYCRKAMVEENDLLVQVMAKPVPKVEKVGILIATSDQPADPLFFAELMYSAKASLFSRLRNEQISTQVQYALSLYKQSNDSIDASNCALQGKVEDTMTALPFSVIKAEFTTPRVVSTTGTHIQKIILDCAERPIFDNVDYKIILLFTESQITDKTISKRPQGNYNDAHDIYAAIVTPGTRAGPYKEMQIREGLDIPIFSDYFDLDKALTASFLQFLSR